MKTRNPLQPVSMPNLNEVVYQLLRERILSYAFAPGQRLDLVELEQLLQVSRTPLKDAMNRLEIEGLVEIHARRGTFVASLDVDKLDDAYKVRSAYELYVALCLFKYLTSEDYAFFRDLQFQMNALANQANWQAVAVDYLALDRQLHERFVLRGGPARMFQLHQQTNVHVYLRLVTPHLSDRDFEATHFEHEQIFDALASQAPDRLNAALLNHLESARLRTTRAFKTSAE